jgi:UDP-N-acetylmuramoylalanine--D-glutamate ligase
MLEAAGKTVRLGGNIGVPPLSFIDDLDADSWVVLELSSFQLSDFRQAPHITVCLMVVPEHLDWHSDFEDYITAKEQLFARQGTADVAIYYHDNETSKRIAGAGQAQKVPYYHSPGAEVIDGSIVIDGTVICRTDELKLLGRHNWQNACAAVTAVWYAASEACGPADKPNIHAIQKVLTSFSGLPHRIQYVREVNGIRFYNDSFATGLHATEAAIMAIPGPKIVILGGYDRMLPLEHLAEFLNQHQDANIKHILIIGASGDRLAATLRAAGITSFTRSNAVTMSEIIQAARSLATSGDSILLSPGFASFDMFKNFEDRGDQYLAGVRAL